jgi:hypothetical protein
MAILLLIVTALMLFPFDAGAQTQKPRKGFVLNLGLGVARVSQSTSGFANSGRSNVGVGSDFKIGHAPSNQVLIYYSNDAAFYRQTGSDDLYLSGLTGFGVTYFLQPTVPSFYVDGSFGIAARGNLETETGFVESTTGWGVAVGGGYEFARHFLVDGDIILGRFDGGMKTTTLRLGLIWLAY